MRSLRRALAARFSLTMFVALTLIALWAYLGAQQRMQHQLDRSLTSSLHLQSAALAAGLPIVFQQESADLETFVQDINRFVTIRDSSGRVVTANTPFAGGLPVDAESFARARRGELSRATQKWANHRIRSLYAPVSADDIPATSVIQVAASLQPLSAANRVVLMFMVGTVILGTAATFFGAGWLADSAAAPVAEIAEQARAITAGTVGRRITAHADVFEFQGLVHVLNAMLGRLDRAMQAQRRIIADVGHDLRTPITAITGQLEVALRSERTPVEYRRVLQSCLEEAIHMGTISEALVLLARLEAQELLPERSNTDLAHVAREAVERARARAGSRAIAIDVPRDGATVFADAGMLRIVFDHLLDNAIKHTPEGTRVAVSLAPNRSYVDLAVEDNGPGIPPDEFPLVFERFYRGDAARERTSSAGLSLTIVAAIVGAHGGSIWAARSHLGGLKIALRLPRTADVPAGGVAET